VGYPLAIKPIDKFAINTKALPAKDFTHIIPVDIIVYLFSSRCSIPREIISRLIKKRVLLNKEQIFLELHNFYAFSDLIKIKMCGIIIYRNWDLNQQKF
jgi:hypothetical protein